MTAREKLELHSANRWVRILKHCKCAAERRRCVGHICAHLKAMITGAPADSYPESRRLPYA